MLVARLAFHHVAGHVAAGLFAQILVGVFVEFQRGEILESEFAADEGAGFVDRGYPFDPLECRQVEPLVVRIEDFRVRQQGGAVDIGRAVEDDQGLVAKLLVGNFQRIEGQRSARFLSGGVAQDHLHFDPAVGKPSVGAVGAGRDGEAFLLRRFGDRGSDCRREQEGGGAIPQQRVAHWSSPFSFCPASAGRGGRGNRKSEPARWPSPSAAPFPR